MLSRAFNRTQAKSLINTLQRGVYTKETQPHVFINEHTKVLVQGMTGKHVSCDLKLIFNCFDIDREPSIPNNPLNTEPMLLVESTRERLALLILIFQFSETLLRPRTLLKLMHLLFMSHHHLLLTLSSKP